MKNFDKVIAAKLRDEINEALQGVARKYDIQIHTGNCTYMETEITYKLKVKTNDPEALKEKEVKTWNQYCQLYGFKKEDFGAEFSSNGKKYKITGLDVGRSKYSLKGVGIDGKTMLFVAEQVAKKLNPETRS